MYITIYIITYIYIYITIYICIYIYIYIFTNHSPAIPVRKSPSASAFWGSLADGGHLRLSWWGSWGRDTPHSWWLTRKKCSYPLVLIWFLYGYYMVILWLLYGSYMVIILTNMKIPAPGLKWKCPIRESRFLSWPSSFITNVSLTSAIYK